MSTNSSSSPSIQSAVSSPSAPNTASHSATFSHPIHLNTTNTAFFLIICIIIICFIHSIGFCNCTAKQLMDQVNSEQQQSKQQQHHQQQQNFVETSTNHPGSSFTPAPIKPEHKTYPDQNVLVGHTAHLPCHVHTGQFVDDTQEPVQEAEDGSNAINAGSLIMSSKSSVVNTPSLDLIQLILWYHGDDISGSPFYSVDARQQQFNQAQSKFGTNFNIDSNETLFHSTAGPLSPANEWKHFLMDPYNERSRFVVNNYYPTMGNVHFSRDKSISSNSNSNDPSSPFMLIIDPVQENDNGLYWCRVDYRWTRTTISKVRLNVHVQPKQLKIYRLEIPIWSLLDLTKETNYQQYFPHRFQLNLKRLFSNDTDDLIRIEKWFQSLLPMEINSPTVSELTANSYHYHHQSLVEVNVDELIYAVFMCESIGGNPLPTIHWYWNNRKLEQPKVPNWTRNWTKTNDGDNEDWVKNFRFKIINTGPIENSTIFNRLIEWNNHSKHNGTTIETAKYQTRVISFLLIRAVESLDQGTIIRCQTNQQSPAVSLSTKSLNKIFKLNINVNPKRAQIIDVKRDGFTSGSMVHATCLSWGAKPAARIHWFVGERALLDSNEIIFESNATTKSTVVLTLKPIDNGRPLTCLAISQPLERLLRKNGTIITSNGQWWSSMENILIRHILFEVKVHKKHYQHEQQQQNQEQQQQPGEKQQQRWQPNQIYKQPTELYRTSDSKINGQNERILFLGNQTDWLNGNDRNDQNGHYPLATSSYFVYDQIILNAQYLPNITIDLLETGTLNSSRIGIGIGSNSHSSSSSFRSGGSSMDRNEHDDYWSNGNKYLKNDYNQNEKRKNSLKNKIDVDDNDNNNNNNNNNQNSRNRKIFVKDRMKLQCLIDSNPPPYKIRWLLNHRDITQLFGQNEYELANDNRTLIIMGPSGAGLDRRHEGKYQCLGYNQLGRADSQELIIAVLRSPKCAFKLSLDSNASPADQTEKIISSINYPTNLFCQIDATFPSVSSLFDNRLWIYWRLPNDRYILTVNQRNGKLLRIPVNKFDQFRKLRLNSKFFPKQDEIYNDDEDDLFLQDDDEDDDGADAADNDDDNNDNAGDDNDYIDRRITLAVNDVRSRLTIIPRSKKDFGLYQCWAENAFGTNRYEPCTFNLINNSLEKVDKIAESNSNTNSNNLLPKSVTNCATNFSVSVVGSIFIYCNYKNYSQIQNAHPFRELPQDKNVQFHLVLKELIHTNLDMHNQQNLHWTKNKTIILSNQTNLIEPVFLISNLRPSGLYEAIIYASNDYGISDQLKILIQMDNDSYSAKETKIFSEYEEQRKLDENRSSHETSVPIHRNNNHFDYRHHFNSFELPTDSEIMFNNGDGIKNGQPAVIVGKPDLHQQQKNSLITESIKKTEFYNDNNVLSSTKNRLGLATTVSLSSSLANNGLNHFDMQHSNNRFVLITIIVFAIIIVAFSSMISVGIGVCLYRRKRTKLLRRHCLQQQNNQQQTVNKFNSEDCKSTLKSDQFDSKVQIKNSEIENGNQLTHHVSPPSTFETYPLNDYSSSGVFILNTGGVSCTAANDANPTITSMMIYRDFVSSPPPSTSSPASSSLHPLGHYRQKQEGPKFISTTVSNQHPEFLFQPTTEQTGFLDLGVDSGNVQLIPSTDQPPTTMAKSLLLPTSTGEMNEDDDGMVANSYLSSLIQQHQPTQPPLGPVCLNSMTSSVTETESIKGTIIPKPYDQNQSLNFATTGPGAAGLSISEI